MFNGSIDVWCFQPAGQRPVLHLRVTALAVLQGTRVNVLADGVSFYTLGKYIGRCETGRVSGLAHSGG